MACFQLILSLFLHFVLSVFASSILHSTQSASTDCNIIFNTPPLIYLGVVRGIMSLSLWILNV